MHDKARKFPAKGHPRIIYTEQRLWFRLSCLHWDNKGQKVKTRTGKVLQEELGRRRITVIPFPEEPLPFPVKSGNAQQKSQIRAQAGPIQGQLSCQTHPNQGPQGAWAPSKPYLQGSRSTGPSGCSHPF